MAQAQSIKIDVEPIIKSATAKLCLSVLELFMNQNPEMDIIGNRLPDGSIQLKFEERKQPEPLVRVKRPEEMTEEHRKELSLYDDI